MIVLVDIGNTRTKYCIVDKGLRSPQQAVLNDRISNAFLSEKFNDANKFIVASVSHEQLTNKISDWCETLNIDYQRVVSDVKKNSVVSGYKIASQLGVDRWLALVAAGALYPKKNVLIVDAGTATTIDFLTSSAQHQGGWILAGIDTLVTSVLADTVQVKAKKVEKESLAFGKTTSENVSNAAWVATVGAINLAISQVKEQGFILHKLIITGGNANLLAPLITHENTVDEELVFSGLQAYI